MKRNLITMVVAVMFSAAAFAGNDNGNNGNGGQGGQGGQGGNATQGQAQGQLQGQAQGQLQGQAQGQGQIGINKSTNVNNNDLRNRNTNTSTNSLNNTNSVGNGIGNFSPSAKSESNSGAAAFSGSKSTSGAIGVGAQGQTQGVTIDQSYTNVNPDRLVTTPPVSAPNIYPTAPCMGSSSAGISVMGFGATGGSSWIDNDCRKQEVARAFDQMGMKADSLAVLCSVEVAAVAPSCKKLAESAAPKTAAVESTPVARSEQGTRSAPARKEDATVRSASVSGGACAINAADADRLGLVVCQ